MLEFWRLIMAGPIAVGEWCADHPEAARRVAVAVVLAVVALVLMA